MKLEKAYSLELKKNITATEADTQFQKTAIRSKFNFQCPDKICGAQVTCANLDRPRPQRKRDPYYKVVGDHSARCSIASDITKQHKQYPKNSLYSSEDLPIADVYRINLQQASTKKVVTGNDGQDSSGRYDIDTNSNKEKMSTKRSQPTKTLASLVDSRSDYSIKIQLPGIGVINIQELFIEINGQNISTFPNKWRIYHGKAWFNKKTNGYSVKFKNKLAAKEVTAQPSFFISNKSLNNSGFAKFSHQSMAKIANNTPKQVFILSETRPDLIDSKYINFWCEAPHCMDYRL